MAWSRQRLIEALIMITDEIVVISPQAWRKQLYEKDMQRHEVLSQA
jgi:hypothetical protein